MDDDLKHKMLAAITPAVQDLAYATADMTFAFLKATGVSSSDMSLLDLLSLSARLKTGAMAASGMLQYVPLEAGSSEAAAQFAAGCRDPEKTANAIKYGLYHDVVMMELKHFTSRDALIQQATEMDGGDANFVIPDKPTPSSPGAKRWAAELNSPLHHLLADGGTVGLCEGMGSSEDEIRAILAKPMITEAEAAILMSISTKALSNKRRDDKNFPRNIYRQKCKKGKVAYITKEVIAFIENGQQKGKRR